MSLHNSITGSGDPADITPIVPSALAASQAASGAVAEGTIGVMPAGSLEPVMELGRLTWLCIINGVSKLASTLPSNFACLFLTVYVVCSTYYDL